MSMYSTSFTSTVYRNLVCTPSGGKCDNQDKKKIKDCNSYFYFFPIGKFSSFEPCLMGEKKH